MNVEAAQKLAAKVKSGAAFDLNDFLGQIQQMKQMGGLSSLMDKLPAALAAKGLCTAGERRGRDLLGPNSTPTSWHGTILHEVLLVVLHARVLLAQLQV